MSKLVVIDGNSLLNTGHRAYRDERILNLNLAGTNLLLSRIDRLIRLGYIPSVVFDSKTSKKKILEGYKENRTFDEDKKQISFLSLKCYDEMKRLGLPVYKEEEKEGDDLIGQIVWNNSGRYDEVLILSGDRDLSAFVANNVSLLDARRDGILINEENYSVTVKRGKFIPYNTITLVKILTGDASDNVSSLCLGKNLNEEIIQRYVKFILDNSIDATMMGLQLVLNIFVDTLTDILSTTIIEQIKKRILVMAFNVENDNKYEIPYSQNKGAWLEVTKSFNVTKILRTHKVSGNPEFLKELSIDYKNFDGIINKERPDYSDSFNGVINGF